MDNYFSLILLFFLSLLLSCKENSTLKDNPKFLTEYLAKSESILNYKGTPANPEDRNMLMFSDQGAWFAYSLPDSELSHGGFSGPFLMTQQNGVWISPTLANFNIVGESSDTEIVNWKKNLISQKSYASHLEQTYVKDSFKIEQQLVFMSGHTALQRTKITNISSKGIALNTNYTGRLFDIETSISQEGNGIKFVSEHSKAIGYMYVVNEVGNILVKDSTAYTIINQTSYLNPTESQEYLVAQTFIFPEYSWSKELTSISNINFDSVMDARKLEKEKELTSIIQQSNRKFQEDKYADVLAKAHITLQNNWRIAAGELKHQGLFPSYHYEWFHGFWSWDSWKHAAGLSLYAPDIAKDQIRAIFDYQADDGFIVDCIYRDTTIEKHNYRNTKPPLSSWAVVTIMKTDRDTAFIKEMYPKLIRYHNWWYSKRDHDKDGLCEYGSTDGTVLAAKWESGMDNAIRFDESRILKNSEGAYSLNQESVDLNAYLYAEKLYLASLAEILGKNKDAHLFKSDAAKLKLLIQDQFYDKEDGWFYDTDLKGTKFLKGAGSEGWTALWANAASQEQAESVKGKMMDSQKFYTKVPFQTMSKDHPKFDPLNGYWRGPNWLDQAYFGIKGLRNYGFDLEANNATVQIMEGAQGVLGKGKSIRENYHPITGEGREAQNFSWSAAHIIMILTKN